MNKAADRIAARLLASEGEQVVRDMAGHVGDQIFEVLRRNGMAMASVAGATGVQTLAAAIILGQADDFLRRSLDGDNDGEATAGVARLFLSQLPPALVAAIRALAKEAGDGHD